MGVAVLMHPETILCDNEALREFAPRPNGEVDPEEAEVPERCGVRDRPVKHRREWVAAVEVLLNRINGAL